MLTNRFAYNRRLWNDEFKVGSWQSQRGYLVDARTGAWLDTGRFKDVSYFVDLPQDGEILRIASSLVERLDSTLDVKAHIELPDSVVAFRINGDQLFIYDHLDRGLLTLIDLKTFKRADLRIPIDELHNSMQEDMHDGELDLVVALAKDSVLVLGGIRNVNPNDSWLDVVVEGHRASSIAVDGEIVLTVDSVGKVTADCTGSLRKAMTGTITTQSGMGRKERYALAEDHTFQQIDQQRGWSMERHMSGPLDGVDVSRDGTLMLRTGMGVGRLCADVLYSSHRNIDHFESYPLRGAEVIRLVRQEKQFGEFWTHINAEPLINKVLGTDAYNMGYSIGQVLHSTWVKLGLLLGAGVLGYAWWSRRRRIRAT